MNHLLHFKDSTEMSRSIFDNHENFQNQFFSDLSYYMKEQKLASTYVSLPNFNSLSVT